MALSPATTPPVGSRSRRARAVSGAARVVDAARPAGGNETRLDRLAAEVVQLQTQLKHLLSRLAIVA